MDTIISRIKQQSTPILKADEDNIQVAFRLIETMLHSDPDQRPTASLEVKNDSYFKEMSGLKTREVVVVSTSVAPSSPSYQVSTYNKMNQIFIVLIVVNVI